MSVASTATAAVSERPTGASLPARLLAFGFGLVTYLFFLGTFAYAAFFVIGAVVPKTMNSGTPGALWPSLLINASFLLAFAVQHTIMARPGFKARWTKIVSPAIERSIFVLLASGILAAMFWQWRPLPGVIWSVEEPVLRGVLTGVSALGFGIVVYATFLIDHFELFGLSQVFRHLRNKPLASKPFTTRGLYRVVRHPLMFGFMVAFWSAPTMTVGHLAFALLSTGYILFGLIVEERDLVRHLGQDYVEYRRTTPKLIPFLGGSRR